MVVVYIIRIHIWGDKMKEVDGGDSGMVYQNTAFHAAAITHILKKYKDIYNNENAVNVT